MVPGFQKYCPCQTKGKCHKIDPKGAGVRRGDLKEGNLFSEWRSPKWASYRRWELGWSLQGRKHVTSQEWGRVGIAVGGAPWNKGTEMEMPG